MWSFFSGSESVQVLNCLFIHVLPLEIQLSRGEGSLEVFVLLILVELMTITA